MAHIIFKLPPAPPIESVHPHTQLAWKLLKDLQAYIADYGELPDVEDIARQLERELEMDPTGRKALSGNQLP